MSKPLLYSCPVCSTGYPLRKQSTIRVYSSQPLVDHLVTTCPTCHNTMHIWDLDENTILGLMRHDTDDPIGLRIDYAAAERTWRKFLIFLLKKGQ